MPTAAELRILRREHVKTLRTAAKAAGVLVVPDGAARAKVELWHIPPRSPDLNPVERFWGWLRKRLRAMDLADLKAGRQPVKKAGLKVRVRALLQSPKAKEVAKNHFLSLHKTCADVKKKRGAASTHG